MIKNRQHRQVYHLTHWSNRIIIQGKCNKMIISILYNFKMKGTASNNLKDIAFRVIEYLAIKDRIVAAILIAKECRFKI